jgi:leader peptidase (prepilin peptidase) / N-methyltransferase
MILYYTALSLYILLLAGVMYFDLKQFIIPNWLTLPAIALALLFCLLSRFGYLDIALRIASTGGMFLAAGFLTSFFLKKETIGGGDIKLITAVGLYKGWQEGLLIIFFSAVSALVSVLVLTALKKRKMEDRIPFGFYIALCGILYEGIEMWYRL